MPVVHAKISLIQRPKKNTANRYDMYCTIGPIDTPIWKTEERAATFLTEVAVRDR